MKNDKLESGYLYHIYNHTAGKRDLFLTENYEHFLSLFDKYILPIADTCAWVLMKNHFHFLVKINKEEEIGFYRKINSDRSDDSVRFQKTTDLSEFGEPGRFDINKLKRPDPTKHFSHLFNAYSKYLNIVSDTRGALFESPFKRKRIDNIHYLKKVILYIHNNPAHNGF